MTYISSSTHNRGDKDIYKFGWLIVANTNSNADMWEYYYCWYNPIIVYCIYNYTKYLCNIYVDMTNIHITRIAAQEDGKGRRAKLVWWANWDSVNVLNMSKEDRTLKNKLNAMCLWISSLFAMQFKQDHRFDIDRNCAWESQQHFFNKFWTTWRSYNTSEKYSKWQSPPNLAAYFIINMGGHNRVLIFDIIQAFESRVLCVWCNEGRG